MLFRSKVRLALGATLLGDGYFAYMPFNPELDRPACTYVDPTTRLPHAELDEFKAGIANRWGYLGVARGDALRLPQTRGPELLANGDFERDIAGVTITTLGRSRAALARDTTTAARGSASLKVAITQLDPDPADNKVTVTLGTFAARRGAEYTLRLRVAADPKYQAVDPALAGLPRRVAFAVEAAGVPATQAPSQDVMADQTWREYSLTFVAPADDGAAKLVVQLGMEAGEVWLDDLRLQAGSGDVFARRFERGVVLVNASLQPVAFDLAALFPGMALKRLLGTQDPGVNTGATEARTTSVPGRDALILITE